MKIKIYVVVERWDNWDGCIVASNTFDQLDSHQGATESAEGFLRIKGYILVSRQNSPQSRWVKETTDPDQCVSLFAEVYQTYYELPV